MKNSLTKLLAVGSFVVGGVVISGSAQAAALSGDVSISPFAPGGVVLTGTGSTFLGNPVTTFDFKPDPLAPSNSGTVFEVNGTDDFAAFAGDFGFIRDLDSTDVSNFIADALGGPDYVKTDFIRVYGRGGNGIYDVNPTTPKISGATDDVYEFSFDLDDISAASYDTTTIAGKLSTTVSLTLTGTFINQLDGGSKSSGVFNAGVTFPNLDTAGVQALFDQAGEKTIAQNYALQGVATPTPTPEASTVSALLGFGLLGSMFAFRKKANVKLGN